MSKGVASSERDHRTVGWKEAPLEVGCADALALPPQAPPTPPKAHNRYRNHVGADMKREEAPSCSLPRTMSCFVE